MTNIVGGTIVWNLDAETSEFENKLKDAKNIAENIGKDINNAFKDTSANIESSFKNTITGISDGLKEVGNKMTSFGKDMSVAVTAPLAGLGAVAVDFATIAGKYSSVKDSFKSMTKDMGINADKFQADVAKATGNQLDNLTILQAATRGLSLIGKEAFNDFGGDFVKMAELSKKAARATGQDVDFMFNSLVLGISRESKLILDNLGISLDLTAVKEAYAQTLGKDVDSLTQSEAKHAVLNATLTQLQETYGNVKVSAGGFQGAMQQLTTELTNARISIGAELEPEIAKLTKALVQLIQDVLPSIINAVRTVIDWFTSLSPTMQKVVIGIAVFAAVLGPVLAIFGLWISAIAGIIGAFSALAPLVGVIGAVLGALLSPIGLVVAAIIGLIAVGVLLYRNWDTIKNFASELARHVVNTFNSWINTIGNNIRWIIEQFNNLPRYISNAMSQVYNAITEPFRRAWEFGQEMGRRIREALDQINPFHRNSPSLVDNVIAGVKEIKAQYGSLDSISLPQISSQSLPLTNIEDNYGQGINKKDITVNIGKVTNAQDIDMISREIAYRLALA